MWSYLFPPGHLHEMVGLKNFEEAGKQCIRHGGHLAIITPEELGSSIFTSTLTKFVPLFDYNFENVQVVWVCHCENQQWPPNNFSSSKPKFLESPEELIQVLQFNFANASVSAVPVSAKRELKSIELRYIVYKHIVSNTSHKISLNNIDQCQVFAFVFVKIIVNFNRFNQHLLC